MFRVWWVLTFFVGQAASAATFSGYEIQGQIVASGFPLIEHYFDNTITSGKVVNSFGAFADRTGTDLGPLALTFNAPQGSSCSYRSRVPQQVNGLAQNLTLTHGRFFAHYADYPQYLAGQGYCGSGLQLSIGGDLLTVRTVISGYDDGILDIYFAGRGTLETANGTHRVNMLLTTRFDVTGANYELLVSSAPVPLPPAAGLLAAGLLGLGVVRRRRGPTGAQPFTAPSERPETR